MILQREEDGLDHETEQDYWRVIGQLNFLEKSSRPVIAYAVHQYARFVANPTTSHKHAILRIRSYLMKTRTWDCLCSLKTLLLSFGSMLNFVEIVIKQLLGLTDLLQNHELDSSSHTQAVHSHGHQECIQRWH